MWLLLLLACDDTLFLTPEPAATEGGDGWCGVRGLFASQCASCHSAAGALGGLDLETDPHGALVDVASATDGSLLVEPGAPDASLLYLKLAGTQSAAQGGRMPPTSAIGDATLELVRTWIADGADDVCSGTGSTPTAQGYHPDGWSAPAVHGLAAKFRDQDCTTCHGAAFDGGSTGVACASCHEAATPDWTTECSFCHGEAGWAPDDATDPWPDHWVAAPPQDIDDETDPASISFPPHRLHLRSELHADWDCTTCHVRPYSVFDPGHVFFDDTTAGRAEVVFSSDLPTATYDGNGTCGVSCHFGSVRATDTVSCGGCHPVGPALPPPHDKHLEARIECNECHPTANATADGIESSAKDLHVDGAIDLDLPNTIDADRSGAVVQCTGACHGQLHNSRRWADDD